MANAVLLTLQEYGRPVYGSKSMGQLPAMQLSVEVWTSLGPRLATHAPCLLLFQDFCLDLRGFVGWVGRLVDPCFCAAAVLKRAACATSVTLGRLLLRADVSVAACSGAGLLFLTMLVLWLAIEDFLVLFIESSNKSTPNKFAFLK